MTLTSTNKKFTFCGCSATVGHGLELEKSDPRLWVNVVAKEYSAEVKNLGTKGNSNHTIFMSALNELLFDPPSKLFVQWTTLNRFQVCPGPDNKANLAGFDIPFDIVHKDLFYSKKELDKFVATYHLLNNDYNYLTTLINYCNILDVISKKTKTQLIFINLAVEWTEEIADIDTATNFSEKLSEYSKDILEFNSSPDDEIYDLFSKLNKEVNTMNKKLWINMFNSWVSIEVDRGLDDHPGPESHKIYSDMVINYLESHND